MSRQNYYVLVKKVVFWLWKILESDDFAEGGFGGVSIGGEKGHRLVELLGKGGDGVVLEVIVGEKVGRSGGGTAKKLENGEVFNYPRSAGGRERSIESGLVELF